MEYFLERRCTKIIINNKDQPRTTTVERTFPPCWLSSLILLPSFCMPKGSLFLLDSSLLLCKEYEYSKWWNIFLDVSKIIINNKDQPKTTTNVPFLLADVLPWFFSLLSACVPRSSSFVAKGLLTSWLQGDDASSHAPLRRGWFTWMFRVFVVSYNVNNDVGGIGLGLQRKR